MILSGDTTSFVTVSIPPGFAVYLQYLYIIMVTIAMDFNLLQFFIGVCCKPRGGWKSTGLRKVRPVMVVAMARERTK